MICMFRFFFKKTLFIFDDKNIIQDTSFGHAQNLVFFIIKNKKDFLKKKTKEFGKYHNPDLLKLEVNYCQQGENIFLPPANPRYNLFVFYHKKIILVYLNM